MKIFLVIITIIKMNTKNINQPLGSKLDEKNSYNYFNTFYLQFSTGR